MGVEVVEIAEVDGPGARSHRDELRWLVVVRTPALEAAPAGEGLGGA